MREFRALWEYPENQLIEHLEARGYVVRHKRKSRPVLSWNRVAPIPAGIDFKKEALESIRGQLKQEHLFFETHSSPGIGRIYGDTIHTGALRVFR